ncbi:MAG: hypothetical protein US57_C0005G0061 [Candidatus Moranbacteria bacterium GW2011_GWC2_37_73]|nr:MAG: hypothetical protein UR95_C0001G0165 [Parcubacteria group bacterium GW2011_GWC1_36_108]KKQ40105.1 MAG: hypothetical protein US57_C0005G0061 [Candidatus Moranbacteria bacterium GW2011_GWC2_37_73]
MIYYIDLCYLKIKAVLYKQEASNREEEDMTENKNAINCAGVPFVPGGMTLKEHVEGGILVWNPAMIKPFLFKEQRRCGGILGRKLLELYPLRSIQAVHGNILDFLLENPACIRAEWNSLVFLDPIFEAYDKSLHVRQLIREINGRYHASLLWLDVSMCEIHPVALLNEDVSM